MSDSSFLERSAVVVLLETTRTKTEDFLCLIAFSSNKNESRRCALNRCNAVRLVLTALEDQCEGQL